MKVTKVDKLRVAVSRVKADGRREYRCRSLYAKARRVCYEYSSR